MKNKWTQTSRHHVAVLAVAMSAAGIGCGTVQSDSEQDGGAEVRVQALSATEVVKVWTAPT